MCDEQRSSSEEVLKMLVENHRAFLAFVERRVGNRDVAEELLQAAFVKNVEKLDTVRETAVGWFYRVLRNAIVDHHRRQTVADKRFAAYVRDAEAADARDDELHGMVCKCVAALARTLKPEYAEALREVELGGISVKDYAQKLGISRNNAGVRVFRAREALRRQVERACGTCAAHGCLDCTCAADSHGCRGIP
jgi:RNA polymerase sigma-70 factor (ECF subfamily)